MTSVGARRLAWGAVVLWAIGSPTSLNAQLGIGTWVKQPTTASAGRMTMTVEACCGTGRRLTYRLADGTTVLMSVESPFDGTEVPVMAGGKPTGETMAIKRLDDHHLIAVIKMNGKPFGTSKSTLSADGNTLTVENDMSEVSGAPGGKQTEIWVRK